MLNETLQIIQQRRSVRKYKPEQIKDSELQAILQAAIYAPSAINQQKCHYTVIQNKDLLDQMVVIIKENLLNSGNEQLAKRAQMEDFNPFHHAPTLIIISGDGQHFNYLDCGAAAQNICLAAESLNIGSCFIGFTRLLFASDQRKALSKQLGIPDGYQFIISVALGYKAEENQAAPVRKTDVFTYIK